MPKKPNPTLIDGDNPEWTEAMFKQSVRLNDLPLGLRTKLARPPRGPQKTPVKLSTTIRLSPDVISAFRAGGRLAGSHRRRTQRLAAYPCGYVTLSLAQGIAAGRW